jgi:hypothetical protein
MHTWLVFTEVLYHKTKRAQHPEYHRRSWGKR